MPEIGIDHSLGRPKEAQKMLDLPDTLSTWPWVGKPANPHWPAADAESKVWLSTFSPLLSKKGKAMIELGQFGLASGLCFPSLPKDQLRVGLDLLYVGFILDDYFDYESLEDTRNAVENVLLPILVNPHEPRPAGEPFIGQLFKEFWLSVVAVATQSSIRHFLSVCVPWLKAFVTQAEDRANRTLETVEDYLPHRRDSAGIGTFIIAAELHSTLPDEVFFHPTLQEMQTIITELTGVDNDILSYNKEQAVGDDRWNIVAIAMRQYNLDANAAMKWVCAHHQKRQSEFVCLLKELPSFGPAVDNDLKPWIEILTNLPRATVAWTYGCKRYFGDHGLSIQQAGRVALREKQEADPAFA